MVFPGTQPLFGDKMFGGYYNYPKATNRFYEVRGAELTSDQRVFGARMAETIRTTTLRYSSGIHITPSQNIAWLAAIIRDQLGIRVAFRYPQPKKIGSVEVWRRFDAENPRDLMETIFHNGDALQIIAQYGEGREAAAASVLDIMENLLGDNMALGGRAGDNDAIRRYAAQVHDLKRSAGARMSVRPLEPDGDHPRDLVDQFIAEQMQRGSKVWQIALHMSGRHSEVASAEDIIDEVFLHFEEKHQHLLDLIDPTLNVTAYLLTVFYHEAVNIFRAFYREHPRKTSAAGDHILDFEDLSHPDSQGEAISHEEADILNRHLADLPEKLRIPLRMRFYDGMTNAEIAAAIGVSEGVVEYRILDAEKLLRLRYHVGEKAPDAAEIEDLRRFESVLLELPDAARDVAIPFMTEGKHYDAISAELGIPEGTVKSRMHTAHEILHRKGYPLEKLKAIKRLYFRKNLSGGTEKNGARMAVQFGPSGLKARLEKELGRELGYNDYDYFNITNYKVLVSHGKGRMIDGIAFGRDDEDRVYTFGVLGDARYSDAHADHGGIEITTYADSSKRDLRDQWLIRQTGSGHELTFFQDGQPHTLRLFLWEPASGARMAESDHAGRVVIPAPDMKAFWELDISFKEYLEKLTQLQKADPQRLGKSKWLTMLIHGLSNRIHIMSLWMEAAASNAAEPNAVVARQFAVWHEDVRLSTELLGVIDRSLASSRSGVQWQNDPRVLQWKIENHADHMLFWESLSGFLSGDLDPKDQPVIDQISLSVSELHRKFDLWL